MKRISVTDDPNIGHAPFREDAPHFSCALRVCRVPVQDSLREDGFKVRLFHQARSGYQAPRPAPGRSFMYEVGYWKAWGLYSSTAAV
jgi:hypothetical protein